MMDVFVLWLGGDAMLRRSACHQCREEDQEPAQAGVPARHDPGGQVGGQTHRVHKSGPRLYTPAFVAGV